MAYVVPKKETGSHRTAIYTWDKYGVILSKIVIASPYWRYCIYTVLQQRNVVNLYTGLRSARKLLCVELYTS